MRTTFGSRQTWFPCGHRLRTCRRGPSRHGKQSAISGWHLERRADIWNAPLRLFSPDRRRASASQRKRSASTSSDRGSLCLLPRVTLTRDTRVISITALTARVTFRSLDMQGLRKILRSLGIVAFFTLACWLFIDATLRGPGEYQLWIALANRRGGPGGHLVLVAVRVNPDPNHVALQ